MLHFDVFTVSFHGRTYSLVPLEMDNICLTIRGYGSNCQSFSCAESVHCVLHITLTCFFFWSYPRNANMCMGQVIIGTLFCLQYIIHFFDFVSSTLKLSIQLFNSESIAVSAASCIHQNYLYPPIKHLQV